MLRKRVGAAASLVVATALCGLIPLSVGADPAPAAVVTVTGNVVNGTDGPDNIRLQEYPNRVDVFVMPGRNFSGGVLVGSIPKPVALINVFLQGGDDFFLGVGVSTVPIFASGGEGADAIRGGQANDTLRGDNGDDYLKGANGDDRLEGGAGIDQLDGDAGNDTLIGGADRDQLNGGADTDEVIYSDSPGAVLVDLQVSTQEKPDPLDPLSTVTTYIGVAVNLGATGDAPGAGDVILNVEDIEGSVYDDQLYGSELVNAIAGSGGNDQIFGREGNDTLVGDQGKTSSVGYAQGNDIIDGGEGKDRLFGNDGDDTLIGGTEADKFDGGAGNDTAPDFNAGEGDTKVNIP